MGVHLVVDSCRYAHAVRCCVNVRRVSWTFAEKNNDIDSSLKTFFGALIVPRFAGAGQAIPVSGYAQVSVSGLSKVQITIESAARL